MNEYLSIAIRLILFTLSNIYGLLAYLMWTIVLMPLRYLAPEVHWKLEARLFKFLQCMIVTWYNGYKIIECGEDIGLLADEEALVLCNHQSTADTGYLMIANHNKGNATGHAMWVMWALFRYTNFGLVSTLRRDIFIEVGKEKREQELENMKQHLLNYYVPNNRKWLMVFPEGGFLHKRLESSQRYAEKNGHPKLNHVTLPRIGVVKTVLQTLGEPYKGGNTDSDNSSDITPQQSEVQRPIKWVIDATMAYADQSDPHDFLGICIGTRPKTEILMHYRAYRVQDIPRDEEGLTKWLYDRYEEKDQLLSHYYTHGGLSEKFLASKSFLPAMKMSYVRFDKVEQLLIHGFFLLTCILHWNVIYKPLFGFVSNVFGLLF